MKSYPRAPAEAMHTAGAPPRAGLPGLEYLSTEPGEALASLLGPGASGVPVSWAVPADPSSRSLMTTNRKSASRPTVVLQFGGPYGAESGTQARRGAYEVLPRIGASITFCGMAVVRQFEQMDIYTPTTAAGIANSRSTAPTAQLPTDQSSYASGDLGTLTLRNTAPFRSLHVAWCVVALQRRDGEEWVFVRGDLSGWEAPGEASGAALSCFCSLRFVVQPRRTVVAPSGVLGFLLSDAEPGEYRAALGVWQQQGDRRVLVFSNSFHFVE